MYKLALLGRDISYTRSPAVHKAIFDALGEELSFEVVDVPYDSLKTEVHRLLKECDAFYITKPYKNDIKDYIKTCNTGCGVNFVKCADASGYNTDGTGFLYALDRAFGIWRADVDAALILGAGGAAFSVAEALINAGKKVYVLNRTAMNAAKLCTQTGAQMYTNQPAQLVVNCTSLGLHGEDVLYSLCVLPDFKYAFDLIYSPEVTPFMTRCGSAGGQVSNGGDMLVFQAIAGDSMLTGKNIEIPAFFEKVNKLLQG